MATSHTQLGASTQSVQHPATTLRSPDIHGAVLIACLALLAYLPALNGGFIWDDYDLLVNNTLIKASDGLYRLWCTDQPIDYWPMTYTTFWIEWRLWNMNPTGYHFTNLLLHVAAALLAWKILRRLGVAGAFLAALLFAVHPVNVESVAWIAQRKNTLAIVFFLLSIWWYLRAEESREATRWALWYGLSLLAFTLAMLSKGSVAILPFILLLIVWWRQRQIGAPDLVRTAPFFLVALLLTAVNIWFQTHGTFLVVRSASIAQRTAGAGAAVWFYLCKALLPIQLVFVYPQWNISTENLLWWLPLLAAAVVTALLWRKRNLRPCSWGRALWFAWAFFCLALAPVLGFTDVYFMRYSLVADHYEYIALLAVAALAAAGWSAWRSAPGRSTQWTSTAVAAIVVAALTWMSWQQSRMYRDQTTLYKTTLERNPTCWMAHNNLGIVLRNLGQYSEAAEQFRQALQLNPRFAEAHYCLGLEFARAGQSDQAIEEYHHALQCNPNYVQAYLDLGNTLLGLGRIDDARKSYEKALDLQPTSAEAHNNLGYALFKSNRPGEAIEEYKLAVHFDPEYLKAHLNLAIALAGEGQFSEAIEHYQEALRIKPNSIDALFHIAQAYSQLQQAPQAIACAERASNLARSSGQTALAQTIEAWLSNYRAQQANPQHAAPSNAADSGAARGQK